MKRTIWLSIFLFTGIAAFGDSELLAQTDSLSLKLKADSLADKAWDFTTLRSYDSAAYYYLAASEVYLANNDLIRHFQMRIEQSSEIYRAGRFEESTAKSLAIAREAKEVKGGNVVFYAYLNLATQALERSEIELAQEYYALAEESFEELDTRKTNMLRALMYMGQGYIYSNQQFALKAQEYYEKVEHLFESKDILHPNAGINYHNLAGLAQEQGLIKKAEYYLKKQLEIINQLPPTKGNRNLMLNYTAQGDLAAERYAYKEAIELLTEALNLSLQATPRDFRTPEIKEHLSGVYMNMGEEEKALELKQEALDHNIRLHGQSSSFTAQAYTNLAKYFRRMGDHEQALQYFRQASAIYEPLEFPINETQYPQALFLEGTTMAMKGDESKGFSTIYNALGIVKNSEYDQGNIIFGMYSDLGDLFYDLAQYDSSVYYYQKTLTTKSPEFSSMDLMKNPASEAFQDDATLLSLLTRKAQSLGRIADKKPESLNAVYATVLKADTLARQLRTRPRIFADKLTYQKRVSEINGLAFRTANRLYDLTKESRYLDQAFQFADKDKASLVLFSIQENIFLNQSSLPDSLIALGEDYEAGISYLEAEIYSSNDSIKTEYYRNRLLKERDRQAAFLDQIRENYPSYYREKYADNHIDLDQVRKQLIGRNKLLIAYHLDEGKLYTFAIDKRKTKLIKTQVTADLDSIVSAYLGALDKPAQSAAEFKKFKALNERLSSILLPDTLQIENYQSLTIIPDDIIALVPFATLSTNSQKEATGFQGLEYLVKSHAISYASSAMVLSRQIEQPKIFETNEVLAFAPVFNVPGQNALAMNDTVRSGLGELSWVSDEVSGISNHFITQPFVEQQATEKIFKQLSSEYAIVHVASHGLLNEEDPMYSKLVFAPFDTDSVNDGYLNTREIFNLDVPAEMVVLSACNTGRGEVFTGEGILSLANSFFYAGSKSLVMTLWTANDQSSSLIMDQFYKNLAQGESKSQALRHAKLSYLEERNGLLAHPYYWAHFVVNGDDRPLLKSSPDYYLLALILLFVLSAILLIKKKKYTS
ncbi:MAG: CHAT domain-containing protein [Roseivirga sp.]|nr:CHAT domain-containing protein [Roseivirga sp.]